MDCWICLPKIIPIAMLSLAYVAILPLIIVNFLCATQWHPQQFKHRFMCFIWFFWEMVLARRLDHAPRWRELCWNVPPLDFNHVASPIYLLFLPLPRCIWGVATYGEFWSSCGQDGPRLGKPSSGSQWSLPPIPSLLHINWGFNSETTMI